MELTSIPGARRRIILIILLTLAGLILRAVTSLSDELTVLRAAGLLTYTLLEAFLIKGLCDALRPEKAYSGLGIISVVQKIRFIIGCVLMGLVALIYLFLIVSAAHLDAGSQEMMIFLVFALVPTAVILTRTVYYRKTARLASQLRRDAYVSSQDSETWALVCAAAISIYIVTVLLARYAAPTVSEAADGSMEQQLLAALSDTIGRGNGRHFSHILDRIVSPFVQCALYFIVYRLLYALRMNMPASEQVKEEN